MVTLQEIEPSRRHSSTVMQPSPEDMDLKDPKKDNRKVQSTCPGHAPLHPASRSCEEIEPSQRHSSTVIQHSPEDMDLKDPKKDNIKVHSASPGHAPLHPANCSWEEIEPSQRYSSAVTQPSSEYMDLKEPREDNGFVQNTNPGYAPPHPAKRSWEVPRHNVTIEKVIGKGSFGQVAKGTAVGLQGRPDTTTVAIKMLKSESSIDFRIFLTSFFFSFFRFLLCIL